MAERCTASRHLPRYLLRPIQFFQYIPVSCINPSTKAWCVRLVIRFTHLRQHRVLLWTQLGRSLLQDGQWNMRCIRSTLRWIRDVLMFLAGVLPFLNLSQDEDDDLPLFQLEIARHDWTQQTSAFEMFYPEIDLRIGRDAAVRRPGEATKIQGYVGGLEDRFTHSCAAIGYRVVVDNLNQSAGAKHFGLTVASCLFRQ